MSRTYSKKLSTINLGSMEELHQYGPLSSESSAVAIVGSRSSGEPAGSYDFLLTVSTLMAEGGIHYLCGISCLIHHITTNTRITQLTIVYASEDTKEHATALAIAFSKLLGEKSDACGYRHLSAWEKTPAEAVTDLQKRTVDQVERFLSKFTSIIDKPRPNQLEVGSIVFLGEDREYRVASGIADIMEITRRGCPEDMLVTIRDRVGTRQLDATYVEALISYPSPSRQLKKVHSWAEFARNSRYQIGRGKNLTHDETLCLIEAYIHATLGPTAWVSTNKLSMEVRNNLTPISKGSAWGIRMYPRKKVLAFAHRVRTKVLEKHEVVNKQWRKAMAEEAAEYFRSEESMLDKRIDAEYGDNSDTGSEYSDVDPSELEWDMMSDAEIADQATRYLEDDFYHEDRVNRSERD